MLLERLWGPLGASLTALRVSWEALARALGDRRELLVTSSAQETLYFSKTSVSLRWEHDFRNLYYQGTGSETMRERLFARK